MQPLDLLIITLATFYAAYAISHSEGPWKLFERLRARLPLGGLTGCLVCLSPWMAGIFFVIQQTPLSPIGNILAIAGASVLVYRYTGGDHV